METILPLNVMDVIKQLNLQFKDKKEFRNDGNRYNKKRNDRNKAPSEPFNATVIQKKEGIDVTIGSIKTNLFKLTDQNTSLITPIIMEDIDKVMKDATEEEQIKVLNDIFNTMTVNKIFSAIYSKIYKCCYDKYDIFKTKLSDEIMKYKNNLKTIVFVSVNENYEEFCKYNTSNETRKAKTSLFTNMMKEGIISMNKLEELLQYVCDELDKKMQTEGNKEVVEELSENIFLFLSLTKYEMKKQNKLEKWKSYVESMSKKSTSQYKSYSSRSKFKYMDILDIYNGKSR